MIWVVTIDILHCWTHESSYKVEDLFSNVCYIFLFTLSRISAISQPDMAKTSHGVEMFHLALRIRLCMAPWRNDDELLGFHRVAIFSPTGNCFCTFLSFLFTNYISPCPEEGRVFRCMCDVVHVYTCGAALTSAAVFSLQLPTVTSSLWAECLL